MVKMSGEGLEKVSGESGGEGASDCSEGPK